MELGEKANATFWKKFGNASKDKPSIGKTVALSEAMEDVKVSR